MFGGEPAQEKLRELKERGVEITRTLEIPLIAYLGDTQPGPHLVREDVRKAQIVICECTFFEPDHKDRAKVGMHMHVDDIAEWIRVLECQNLIIVHVSRRTDLGYARKRLAQAVGEELEKKVLFMMDFRTQRTRYEQQEAEARAMEAKLAARTPAPPSSHSSEENDAEE